MTETLEIRRIEPGVADDERNNEPEGEDDETDLGSDVERISIGRVASTPPPACAGSAPTLSATSGNSATIDVSESDDANRGGLETVEKR